MSLDSDTKAQRPSISDARVSRPAGASGELRCEIVTNPDSWLAKRRTIDDLLSTCSLTNAHTTTTWLSCWWKALGAGEDLRVGLFWRGRELVGYAPLMISRRRVLGVPYRVLRFIGDGISDYADVFSRADDPTITASMVQTIVRQWRWNELNLANVRQGSTTIAAFEGLASNGSFQRIRREEPRVYIDLRGLTFEQYAGSLSRKHRRDLRKHRRALDAVGPWSLDFELTKPAGDIFDELRHLHTARSNQMGWISVYDLPGFRPFFMTLIQEQRSDFQVLCSTLRQQDTLVSYTLGFVTNGVYYHWNVGFNDAYRAIAPNKLHHQFLIEECVRRGYAEFDFMRGGYDYKLRWTSTARDSYRIRMLKRGGWRWPVNQILWLAEREPGSTADRCIAAARAIAAVWRGPRTQPPPDAAEKTETSEAIETSETGETSEPSERTGAAPEPRIAADALEARGSTSDSMP